MLSVCLITQDQAALLPRLLANVAPVADEIVAVDGGSSDDTERILRAHPKVRYFARRFDGFASQKNFGFDQAKGDWILAIDTDELLSRSLAAFLPGLSRTCCRRWFKLPRRWLVSLDPPRYVRSKALYPDWQLRLFRNVPPFRYVAGREVHEHFPKYGRGRGLKLRGAGHILHLDFVLNDRARREAKVARYAALDPSAQQTNAMYLWEDLPHEVLPGDDDGPPATVGAAGAPGPA